MINEMFSRLSLDWWLPENFYPGQTSGYALGVFGACYKYAVFMNLAVQSFRFAAEPFFFSQAAKEDSRILFGRVNHYFVIATSIILLGVSTNMDILKYILGDVEYWSGLGIVPILLLAYLCLGMYYNFSVWFKVTDKTHYGTWITLGGAIVTIACNYILIPRMGYVGSSWAALTCYAGMAIACYLLGQRFYPVPYKIGNSLIYIVSALVLIFGINSIKIETQWLATTFHLVMLIGFTLVAFVLERKGFPTIPKAEQSGNKNR
jgi:O-antigen/teichoic acid export membrane protein